MKTIGLIGGISSEATAIYYREINAGVRARLGGFNSARMVIQSMNFAEYNGAHETRDWPFIRSGFDTAARALEQGGADVIALACNTLHTVADSISGATTRPFLHIVDCCAERLLADGRQRPALLGTAFTMSEPYFPDRLAEASGLAPLRPDPEAQAELSRIIFHELTLGEVRPESRDIYIAEVERLAARGADSLILGCTELGMLLGPETSPLPVYDTALIHCEALVDYALA